MILLPPILEKQSHGSMAQNRLKSANRRFQLKQENGLKRGG